MVRFQSMLRQVEFESLVKLADRERRDVRNQASLLIAEGLQRRGYQVAEAMSDVSTNVAANVAAEGSRQQPGGVATVA